MKTGSPYFDFESHNTCVNIKVFYTQVNSDYTVIIRFISSQLLLSYLYQEALWILRQPKIKNSDIQITKLKNRNIKAQSIHLEKWSKII